VAHPPPAELRRQAAALNTMGKRHWKHIVCRSGKAKRAKPPQVGTAAPSVGAAGNVVAVVAGGAAATQDEPTHQYDEEHTTADGQEQQIPEDHEEAETSREIKKLRATVASLKSALARSRDQCARQRAKLRDLEVHSGNLVMQLQAEDSRWRKLCRTQKRKCQRMATKLRELGSGSGSEADGDDDGDEQVLADAAKASDAAFNTLRDFADVVANVIATDAEAAAGLTGDIDVSGDEEKESLPRQPRRRSKAPQLPIVDDGAMDWELDECNDDIGEIYEQPAHRPPALSHYQPVQSEPQPPAHTQTAQPQLIRPQPQHAAQPAAQPEMQHQNNKVEELQPQASKKVNTKDIKYIPRSARIRRTNSQPGSTSHARWMTRQRMDLREHFTKLYGHTWAMKYKSSDITKASNLVEVEEPQEGCPTSVFVGILVSFFKSHADLFKDISMQLKIDVAKEAEQRAAWAMEAHYRSMGLAIFCALDMTERRYQALVNYLGNKKATQDGEWARVLLPEGTPIPLLPSKRHVLSQRSRFLHSLGFAIEDESKAAYFDPSKVVEARLKYLWESGKMSLSEGQIVPMQFLGDATTIWKALHVNGTLLCIKVLYDVVDAFKGKENESAQALENLRVLGFYLGDDGKREDLHSALPSLSKDMERLVTSGVTISKTDSQGKQQTVHVNVRLFLGGDLKFIAMLLGLASCSAHCCCPWCLVTQTQLHLSTAELQALGCKDRKTTDLLTWAHVRPDPNVDGSPGEYTCTAAGEVRQKANKRLGLLARWESTPCGVRVKTGDLLVERIEEKRLQWQQQHYNMREGWGPFLPTICLSQVICDTLHVVLRVVPCLFRSTISVHCDKTMANDVATWAWDTLALAISTDIAVQTSTGVKANIGSESWPGLTCTRLLDNFEDLLLLVHHQRSDNHDNSFTAWSLFFAYREELRKGCDDSCTESMGAHADRVRVLGEEFIKAFVTAAAAERVTPYMHIMSVEIPKMIRRWGSMSKYGCQSMERMHQTSQYLAQKKSNRHKQHVAGTVAAGIAVKAMASEMGPAHRGKVRETRVGGHVSKAWHKNASDAIERHAMRMVKWETSGRVSFF